MTSYRDGHSWDEALERLENFVGSYPLDRVLPDLPAIVALARLPDRFLEEDERAHKVILEAIAARPLSSIEQVSHVRTEVELLTLEVRVLVERLLAVDLTSEEAEELAHRLDEVRVRLAEIRTQL